MRKRTNALLVVGIFVCFNSSTSVEAQTEGEASAESGEPAGSPADETGEEPDAAEPAPSGAGDTRPQVRSPSEARPGSAGGRRGSLASGPIISPPPSVEATDPWLYSSYQRLSSAVERRWVSLADCQQRATVHYKGFAPRIKVLIVADRRGRIVRARVRSDPPSPAFEQCVAQVFVRMRVDRHRRRRPQRFVFEMGFSNLDDDEAQPQETADGPREVAATEEHELQPGEGGLPRETPVVEEETEEGTGGAPNFWNRSQLTGNWGGARDALSDRGFDIELVYTGELAGIPVGGVATGLAHLGNVDLAMTFDFERMVGWRGASISAYGLADYNAGVGVSDLAGDLQGLSNIDAGTLVRLYELWFEQNLGDETFSLRVGLYDLNSEFDANETGGLFFNSSHGIGADFAQSGENGPSIFPITSLGVRLRFRPAAEAYLTAVVLDGVPEELWEQRIDLAQGFLIAIEAGYAHVERESGILFKLAAGAWHYTASFPHLLQVDALGDPVPHRGNSGAYGIFEYALFREKGASDQGLDYFLRAGWADAELNAIEYYVGTGLVYTGLIPTRDEDQLGLAAATAIMSPVWRQAQTAAGASPEAFESVLELAYRAQVFGWLGAQLETMYVINPGAEATTANSLYVGGRLELSF